MACADTPATSTTVEERNAEVATNYERGRAFEYRARDKALKRGAVYVMRAASSKGAADLIVLWRDLGERIPHVWVVQCKRDGRLPLNEMEELLRIAEETGATPVLAQAGPNGRGVIFIDLNTRREL